MNSRKTAASNGSVRARRRRLPAWWAASLAASVVWPGLAGCAAAAEPPVTGSVTVDVTIAGGDVTPNGEKLDVSVGQPVVLKVTSDVPDEIHAHTGGDGFALDVQPGTVATGRFTVSSPGSFEVESHHLKKVIVILNAR